MRVEAGQGIPKIPRRDAERFAGPRARASSFVSLVVAVGLVMVAGLAAAQRRAPARATLRGLVHRTSFSGCGQAWIANEVWSEITLTPTGRRARLVVASYTRTESGGVGLLTPEPHHSETERGDTLEWSGVLSRRGAGLRLALRTAIETHDVEGTSTIVQNRTIREATLSCSPEEHDVLGASRAGANDEALERRSLLTCALAMPDGAPPPVLELAVPRFFLTEDAGITTDVEGFPQEPMRVVARVPGGFPRPPLSTSDAPLPAPP